MSYLSLVIPWDRFSLSTYYQQSSNFKNHANLHFLVDEEIYFEEVYNATFENSLSHMGFAAGFKVNCFLSIGGSIRQSKLRLKAYQ